MQPLLSRVLADRVSDALESNQAIALLGPRQCGKSTLARMVLKAYPESVVLDMERPADRAAMEEAEAFFDANSEHLICLDEVQRVPELFPVLRVVIDKHAGNGQFLLLGSASRDLIEKASESLAGRIAYLELTPFLWEEAVRSDVGFTDFWVRGGFPRSLLAGSARASMDWRQEFVRSFLERDLLQLKPRLLPERARRLWMMVAHCHGRILNKSQLAGSLDVDVHTVGNYLDILEAAFMIRRLPAFHSNLRKRQIKSPKIYVRDSGILHALLGIEDYNALLSHPVRGFSWEGLVVDHILARIHPLAQISFYRTAKGAEVDLVVEHAGKTVAIEMKASAAPKVERGYWSVLNDIQPDRAYVVSPVARRYALKGVVEVVSLEEIIEEGLADGWLR